RRGDRSVTLRAFRGRAVAETDPAGLRVLILRGSAEVGADRVESNRVVEVQANSEVRIEDGSDACRLRAQRFDAIRPRTLLVFRGTAGSTSTEGPWRFVSPSRSAEPLEDGARLVPGFTDPVRWVAIALDEPLPYASDMILRATCGGSGSKLCVWADGWYREIARKASPGSSAVEEWPLRGLRKEMVDLVAGEPLRKLMIGVIQEGGQLRTLDVDKLEIRRVLD
ncbi:MAG TPA: hypothetical protein VK661_09690, partial [Planctomycetota bacterium]|nr:hypothetical protein [Planctomycetota bacterium]